MKSQSLLRQRIASGAKRSRPSADRPSVSIASSSANSFRLFADPTGLPVLFPSQSLLRQRIASGVRSPKLSARQYPVSIASSSANSFRRTIGELDARNLDLSLNRFFVSE